MPQIRALDYWSCLSVLKMYSHKRRMEGYRILYMWIVLEGFVPNCGVNLAQHNERLGRKVNIPGLKPNGRQAVQTMRKNSFQINGARLFNSLQLKKKK